VQKKWQQSLVLPQSSARANSSPTTNSLNDNPNELDRYDGYASNAAKCGEQLQKPLNDMHGDIAFFTQPNINSSAGRAFTV